MAFPAVISSSQNIEASGVTTHVVPYPTGLVNGNLLVAICSVKSPGTNPDAIWSVADGWEERVSGANGNAHGTISFKEVDGTEGANTQFTTISAQESVAAILQFSGNSPWRFFRSSGNGATTNAPDPRELDMGPTVEDRTWLPVVLQGNADAGGTNSYPANYNDNQFAVRSSDNATAAFLTYASRELAVALEDPGAFSTVQTLDTLVWTFGVEMTQAAAGPVLSSPLDEATGTTTGQGTITTDTGDGTLYGVVTQSATPPSVAQIQAGQDHLGAAADWSGNQAVSAIGAQVMNATGLAPATGYFFHFQQQNAAVEDSTVATANGFTTTAVPPSFDESVVYDGSIIPVDSILHYEQGGHDGANGAAVFADSSLSMPVNAFVGLVVQNRTKGASAIITGNTATTITGILDNGAVWDAGDEMHVIAAIYPGDIIYCEKQVIATTLAVDVQWYIHDTSAVTDSAVYTQTITTDIFFDGSYTASLKPDGKITLNTDRPILSSAKYFSITSTSAEGSVHTTQDNGTLYYTASIDPDLTIAQIKAAGTSQPVTTTGIQYVSVTGLDPNTGYYLHFVQENAAGDSNNVRTGEFITPVA